MRFVGASCVPRCRTSDLLFELMNDRTENDKAHLRRSKLSVRMSYKYVAPLERRTGHELGSKRDH